MVAAGRVFQGSLPLSRMPRLIPSLASSAGEAVYELQFGRNALGGAELHVHVHALLTLVCQRTLEEFVLPVEVDTRLGLIDNEQQEAALAPDTEPLLLEDGMLRPADVIEDELLLALPLIPVRPGSSLPEPYIAEPESAASPQNKDNPFAVLGKLKKEH